MVMRSHDPHAASAVDLLFTLTLFFGLIQAIKIASWQAGVLWLCTFFMILNEQISVRASESVYNLAIFLLDLGALLAYVTELQLLTVPDGTFGYAPEFWLMISVGWFLSAIWDFTLSRFAEDTESKRNLIKWARNVLLAGLATLVCYALLRVSPTGRSEATFWIRILAQIIPLIIIIWAIAIWNKERFDKMVRLFKLLDDRI